MSLQEITKVPFVDLGAQYNSLREEVLARIEEVLKSSAFILGADVRLFEEEFAAFCEAQHAVGVDSGTSALELALRAFGIGTGDEVIVPANTFIATALAVSYTGAKPVFVEPDPITYNMDVTKLEEAITDKTKAIIPVHLYGQPADMDAILAIARQRSLVVIEDACQAHGARYKGRRTGSMGDAAAFSFYPAKNLGAYGDGGAITTNDAQVAEKIRRLRDYGQSKKYYHDELGYNRRLDTVQAAVLRVKLKYLDSWNEARRQHARLYSQLLEDSCCQIPSVPDYAEPVWHLYVVQVDNRQGLQEYLSSKGISTGIHYPIPIHLQKAYAHLGLKKGAFPVTEELADRILSLPMYAELTRPMVEHVASCIMSVAP
ncbi:MAG: DegT/DnrJ/EryC1/StrS family aminotransferase [Anaerolineae bacterium]|nr:DegT/DnrJ/EryC1/StrS family aminotransferase [Anaerolineae bacterium]